MLERAPFPAQALPQKARAKRVHLVDPGQQPCPGWARRSRLCEFGEYMNEQPLLRLPHKQFVFTLPKVLRVFFRHDKRLHGEISRLIYRLVLDVALIRLFHQEGESDASSDASVAAEPSTGPPRWHGG